MRERIVWLRLHTALVPLLLLLLLLWIYMVGAVDTVVLGAVVAVSIDDLHTRLAQFNATHFLILAPLM